MHGLTETTAANAALLNNFEIVATALIALFLFHERVSGRLFAAIGLITLASALLSLSDAGSLSFSKGSLFVLLAAVCWGLENNCTRAISGKDPAQIIDRLLFKDKLHTLNSLFVLAGAPAPPDAPATS